ncbi:MAG: hypothetical protein GX927_06650 [Lentisphaerae bacterium]|nr:hypothetical protein [Lentisphaerota bacterium]
MVRINWIFLLFLSVGLSFVLADELHLGEKKPLKGIFLGISERSKVSFQVYGEETPRDFDAGKVKKLTLDKPAKVRCFLKRNRKQGKPGQFSGMQDGKCQILFSGEKSEQEIPLLQLHHLEVELDMKDYMTRMEEQRQKKAEKLAGKKKAAKEFISPGRISVLHFTSPELAANSRQGNLAKRLCEGSSSRRPAEYVPIMIDSLESEIARANSLESLPQFWFYSSTGVLITKLTGRFTDEDIEQAFRKAGKGR